MVASSWLILKWRIAYLAPWSRASRTMSSSSGRLPLTTVIDSFFGPLNTCAPTAPEPLAVAMRDAEMITGGGARAAGAPG